MSATAKANKPDTSGAGVTTPAQLERLGEHLRKLRLLKSGERLEALLQHAAAQELPYADFLEQVPNRRLEKPFEVEALVDALEKVIRRQRKGRGP